MTGAGTFENYVYVGAGIPATPDGRLTGQPTASDISPQPYLQVWHAQSCFLATTYRCVLLIYAFDAV